MFLDHMMSHDEEFKKTKYTKSTTEISSFKHTESLVDACCDYAQENITTNSLVSSNSVDTNSSEKSNDHSDKQEKSNADGGVKNNNDDKQVLTAEHEQIVNCRSFQCKLCMRKFTLATTLAHHNRRSHLGLKPYVCAICNSTFSQTSDLVRHVRIHTTEYNSYKCEICNIGLSSRRNLKNHLKIHTEEPKVCKYCKKTFALSSSLIQHIKKHESKSAVSCKICNIPYSHPADLNKHMDKSHSNGRPHKCTTCHKSFAKSCDLTKHIRIHTGEKP